MGQVPGQPVNTNPLSPTGFRFAINRLPNVVFFGQAANLPGFTFSHIDYQTPMSPNIPIPGDSVEFEDLNIKFMVNETMANWLEIYNWVRALSRIKELNLDTQDGQEAKVSDATLFILTSSRNVNIRVFFRDLFPTSVSSLEFDATVTDIDPIIADAIFKFCYYEIEVVDRNQVDFEISEFCATALALEITDASNYVATEDLEVGETVTGGTSGVTGIVSVWTPAAAGSPGSVLTVTNASGVFSSGEVITGGVSGFSITEGGQVTLPP